MAPDPLRIPRVSTSSALATEPWVTWDGETYARAIAAIASRTLFAGLAGDERLLREMRENGKYTPEFEALHQLNVPPVVRAWVKENCWDDLEVRQAIASILMVAMSRWEVEGPQGRQKVGDGEVQVQHSHCKPMCPPPW